MNGHNLLTDFLFDGDGATVQRAKAAHGAMTGRDILTVGFAMSVSGMPSSVREAPAFTDWKRYGSDAADLQTLGHTP